MALVESFFRDDDDGVGEAAILSSSKLAVLNISSPATVVSSLELELFGLVLESEKMVSV